VTSALLFAGCFDEVKPVPFLPDGAPSCDPLCEDAAEADAAPTVDAAPLSDAQPLVDGVATLAGSSEPGAANGDRVVARFDNPVNVIVGLDGRVFVADFNNNLVRAVDPLGNVSTLVERPDFKRPFGMAVGNDGTLYVSTDDNDLGQHDTTSGTVWSVDPDSGDATVIARNLGRPRGIAMLADGRIVLSDNEHHVIRALNPSTGAITPLAGAWDEPGYVDGNGSVARFRNPYGVAVRSDGKIVVADYGNHILRLVSPTGQAGLLAGSGVQGLQDGDRYEAQLDQPQDVALDAAGNVYFTDTGNFVVRRLDFIRFQITTIAGDGTGGYVDNTDLATARFYGLEGIALSPDDTMAFIADGNHGEDGPYHRVRRIILPPLPTAPQ
jgi:DNA-binding beta-propeller fold protein YncE